MKKIIAILFITVTGLIAQTNPEPFDLSKGDYSFVEWSASQPEGSYPNNMIFQMTSVRDPLLEDPMEMDWEYSYDLTSKARINGLESNGISFLNTSITQDDEGAGYLGAAVLAISTLGRENIKVSWKCATISPAEREYAITLQYRIGENGDFNTLNYSYEMESSQGSDDFEVTLPNEVNNQAIVQLRWKYHFVGNQQGHRAELGLDDIYVTSQIVSSLKSSKFNKAHFNFVNLNGNTLQVSAELNSDFIQTEIEILNLLGNKILNKKLYNNNSINEQINIASLPQGQYFVVIRGKNSYIIEKFILLR